MDNFAFAAAVIKFVGALNIGLPALANRIFGGNTGELYLFSPRTWKHQVGLVIITGSVVIWSPLIAIPILKLMRHLRLRVGGGIGSAEHVVVVGILMLLAGLAMDLFQIITSTE